MTTDCIPFSAVPHSTRLFIDFLHHFDKLAAFYSRPPFAKDWWKDETERINLPQERRRAVAAVLEKQNRAFGAHDQTFANIERLKQGAPAVVTGQQVALFGGPMFSVLKALTAILLAEETGSVPVFWLATEDHDLAEVNFTNVPAGDRLETLSTNPPHTDDAPVGTIAFNDEVTGLLKQLEERFGASAVLNFLQESYRPGETFGSAFGRFLARIFTDFGLVLLDPSDTDLHRIAQPIYSDALGRWNEVNEELLKREQELEHAGYHAQVKVTASHTLCFYRQNGARTPVRHDTDKFIVGDARFGPEELIQESREHPERFSANVLLRPIVEDYLLPTLCYIGGPSEIAYFAQVEVVYRKLLGRVTPVLPRISATLIEARQAKLLERYGLRVEDTFRGPEKFREYVAGQTLPESIMKSFDFAVEHLEKALVSIQGPLEKLDPTLASAAENAGSKMRYQLQSLRDKAARAEARKNSETQRHADELSTMFFPNKSLQEREIACAYFLLRHGTGLLQQLKAKLRTGCPDHQVVMVDAGTTRES